MTRQISTQNGIIYSLLVTFTMKIIKIEDNLTAGMELFVEREPAVSNISFRHLTRIFPKKIETEKYLAEDVVPATRPKFGNGSSSTYLQNALVGLRQRCPVRREKIGVVGRMQFTLGMRDQEVDQTVETQLRFLLKRMT